MFYPLLFSDDIPRNRIIYSSDEDIEPVRKPVKRDPPVSESDVVFEYNSSEEEDIYSIDHEGKY